MIDNLLEFHCILHVSGPVFRPESVVDQHQIPIPIEPVNLSIDVEDQILQTYASSLVPVDPLADEVGLLQLIETPVVVEIVLPVLLGLLIGEDDPMHQFLM